MRRLCPRATHFHALAVVLLLALLLALLACLGQATPTSHGTSPPGTSLPSPTPTPTHTPIAGPSVTPAPVSIISFTVSPPEIAPGQPVTLSWQVVAEKATIYLLDEVGRLTLPAFDVPISGTLTITPPETLRNQVQFVLIASTGESYETATASATITCPDVWFFPNPPPTCPREPHYTVMAAQRFERGLMLWTQFNDSIYILYGDDQSPKWDSVPNTWFEGMPESDPSIVPPLGRYAPVRGFGKAWRENKDIQDRLGWAIEREYQLENGAYQCDTAPRYITCYITGPGGTIYVLQPERSGWYVWSGPAPTPTP